MQTPQKPAFISTKSAKKKRIEIHNYKTPVARANSCISRLALSEYQPRGAVICKQFTNLHTSTKLTNNNNVTNIEKYKPLDPLKARAPYLTLTSSKPSNVSVTRPTPDSSKHSQYGIADTITKTSQKPHKTRYEVNGLTYTAFRLIGKGGSAEVYDCFDPSAQKVLALKIIDLAKADPRTSDSIFNEQAILSRLQNCKYVVRMYASDYKAEDNKLLILMEKGDADLGQIMATRGKMDGILILSWWHGMLLAVNEIHQLGVVHADLKLVNFILVRGTIKLIDFGIANFVDPDKTSLIRDYQIGTINYMAPETLKNDPVYQNNRHILTSLENTESKKQKNFVRYGTKADIWSLGCILYYLVFKKHPFEEQKEVGAKLMAITDPKQTITFPKLDNIYLLDTMKSCLQYDPTKRPTAEVLLNHPYVRRALLV